MYKARPESVKFDEIAEGATRRGFRDNWLGEGEINAFALSQDPLRSAVRVDFNRLSHTSTPVFYFKFVKGEHPADIAKNMPGLQELVVRAGEALSPHR